MNQPFESLIKIGHSATDFSPVHLNPTYCLDINNKVQIQNNLRKSSYELIIFERFPSEYFERNTADAASYLVCDSGVVAWLITGDYCSKFKNYIRYMRDAGFKTCILSEAVNLIFFFKEKYI